MVVANLQSASGAYAVMSTVVLPPLEPNTLNLFTYPLPDTRTVTTTLAALRGHYFELYEVGGQGRLLPSPTKFVFGHIYAIEIRGDRPLPLYLAPPRRSPDGTVTNGQ